MQIKTWTYSLILCLLLPDMVEAQPGIKDFYFTDPGKRKVSFPFRQVHNLVVVEATVNGSDTLRFILDTGVQTTLLLDQSDTSGLGLKFSQTIMVAGLGDGQPVAARHSWGNRIAMPGISSENQDILVLPEHSLDLSASMGMKVHGVIGYDLFKSFDVVVNYMRQIITVYPPGNFSPSRRHREVPVILHRFKPYVEAEVPVADGTRQPVRLLLDMGASHAMSLYPFTLEGFTMPDHAPEALLGKGLSGTIYGRIGRIGHFIFGPFQLQNPVVTFPDTASVLVPIGDTLFHAGSIGSEVLRRFEVAISYQNQAIYLRPNRSFRAPFRHNTSGIEVATPSPGLPVYTIEALWPASPALDAGLKPGDQILFVNGEPVNQLKLPELIGLLNGKPGKFLRITVMRNSVLVIVRFRLRDAI